MFDTQNFLLFLRILLNNVLSVFKNVLLKLVEIWCIFIYFFEYIYVTCLLISPCSFFQLTVSWADKIIKRLVFIRLKFANLKRSAFYHPQKKVLEWNGPYIDTNTDVFFLNSLIENELWKKLCVWSWFSTAKKHFLTEFIVLFVSLIYFLQNRDKILISYILGWLVLSL